MSSPFDATEHVGGDAFLVKQDRQLSVSSEPRTLLGILEAALNNPQLLANVEAFGKLLDMQERVAKDQRKVEYMAAMARLAPRLPIVDRNGVVKYEGKEGKAGMNRKYGLYEDIDKAIRPLYSEEGFSVSWKTGEGPGGKIRMSGVCSHKSGHSEEAFIDLPHDSSGGKNAIQAIGSTVLGYGRRMLTTMIFNVRIAGIDTDAIDLSPITEDQTRDLEAAISEVKGSMAGFLKKFKIAKIGDLLKSDLDDALQMVEEKRRASR